jgi:uncharacterized membrane protein YphA (DoxX/SURF4 family)
MVVDVAYLIVVDDAYPDDGSGSALCPVPSGCVQRLFSGFPSGAAGYGLLVLRIALSTYLAIDGVQLLVNLTSQPDGRTATLAAYGTSSLVAAILAAMGLWTPVVQAVCAIGQSVTLAYQLWMYGLSVDAFAAALASTISLSLVLLGPGAYSLDAHLFGRREISIPPVARPPSV